MNKVKLMTDSACDIPVEAERELGIHILPFHIAVGDKSYLERKDFTFDEFYNILLTEPKIPSTSQITHIRFLDEYKVAEAEGYDDIIYVSINGKGSNTYNSAMIAKEQYAAKNPQSNLKIHLIDSKTYCIAYGYPIIEAAKKLKRGSTSAEVVAYLEDWFDSVMIFFAPYTLEFVKKSGRVSCAAAFAGELIGLRPIISFIDGDTKIETKVRGDKSIIPSLLSYAKENAVPETPYLIISGMLKEGPQELFDQAKKQFGYDGVGIFNAGAAIAINAGPKIVGIVVKGKNRRKGR